MWMIAPQLLCGKHLIGEHGEIHKHRHNFVKQHKISNRIFPIVQIEPSSMESRHDELAAEMIRIGYNHQSPFKQPDISYLPKSEREAIVDLANSMTDLKTRCPECCKRINDLI